MKTIPSRLQSLSLATAETAVCRCSSRYVPLKISQYSQESTGVVVSFLIKLQALGLELIKKETPTQVFSYEYC